MSASAAALAGPRAPSKRSRPRRAAASTGAVGMFAEHAEDEEEEELRQQDQAWLEGAGGGAAGAVTVEVAAPPAKKARKTPAAKAAPKRGKAAAAAAAAVAAAAAAASASAAMSQSVAAAPLPASDPASAYAASTAATANLQKQLFEQYMRNSLPSTDAVGLTAAGTPGAATAADASLAAPSFLNPGTASFALGYAAHLANSSSAAGASSAAVGSTAASGFPALPVPPLPPLPSAAAQSALHSASLASFMTPEQQRQMLESFNASKQATAAAGNGRPPLTLTKFPPGASTATTPAPAGKTYSRKDKSLGLLCENFLRLYTPGGVGQSICLDGVAGQLGVERRRIYDIVNILESLDIVARRGKNQYIWHGNSRLGAALSKLALAIEKSGEGFVQHDVLGLNIGSSTAGGTAGGTMPSMSMAGGGHTTQMTFGDAAAGEEEEDASTTGGSGKKRTSGGGGGGVARKSAASSSSVQLVDSRREQSLGHLCQVFVQMFLSPHNSTRIVSLDDAGRWLLGGPVARPGQTEAQAQASFKSRVRRLYDIANVFTSLDLIEKIHLSQTRKPAFKWLGALVYPLDSTVSPDAFTYDTPQKRAGMLLSGGTLGAGLPTAMGGPMAFDPFGMAGFPGGMGGMMGGLPGAGPVAGAAGGVGMGGAGVSPSPPSCPRRATIDTAQLASQALAKASKPAVGGSPTLSAVAGSQQHSEESLRRSFANFDAAKARYAQGGKPVAGSAAASSDLLGKLKRERGDAEVSRAALEAVSALQNQLLQRESSTASIKAEPADASAAAPPSRSGSFARPLALQSRSSSLLQSASGAALTAPSALDPLLFAYAHIPPSSSLRMARLPDSPDASVAAAASSLASLDPRPVAAWDGTRAHAYVSDSRHFLAHYASVLSTWQRKHRGAHMDMELRESSKRRAAVGAGVAATGATTQPAAGLYRMGSRTMAQPLTPATAV